MNFMVCSVQDWVEVCFGCDSSSGSQIRGSARARLIPNQQGIGTIRPNASSKGKIGNNGKEAGNYYIILGLYGENGIEDGNNYIVLLGLYRDNGNEHGNYYSIEAIEEPPTPVPAPKGPFQLGSISLGYL